MKEHRVVSTGESLSFRVIGVLDVAGGRAVHARSGRRRQYPPVFQVAGVDIVDSNPSEVARVYVDRLGLHELYMADLDAIQGRMPQHGMISKVAGIGIPMMVDAGVRSLDDGRRLLEAGASSAVVGLETLPSFEVLDEIASALGRDSVAFSLDLKHGRPILPASSPESMKCMSPSRLAARASAAGVGTLLFIDVARVGGSRGIDLDLVRDLRVTAPGPRLVAGGGIRNWKDLAELSGIGCDGALVATALHSGAMGRPD